MRTKHAANDNPRVRVNMYAFLQAVVVKQLFRFGDFLFLVANRGCQYQEIIGKRKKSTAERKRLCL